MSALDRFFYSPNARVNAALYIARRGVDATKLKRELSFTFYTSDALRARIYGHTILVALNKNALHCGDEPGSGDFYRYGMDAGVEDPIMFDSIDQVVAYILAVNW